LNIANILVEKIIASIKSIETTDADMILKISMIEEFIKHAKLSAAARKCTKSGGLKMQVRNGSKSSHWMPLSGSSDRLITEAESFRFRLFPSFDSFCPQ
jgi:hypothetical protein